MSSISASFSEMEQAILRYGQRPGIFVERTLKERPRGHSGHGETVTVMSETQPRGHAAERLRKDHARQMPDVIERCRRGGLDEGNRHILPLCQQPVKIEHEENPVPHGSRDDGNAHSQCQSESREKCLPRPALDVPEGHAHRGTGQIGEAETLQ